MTNDNNYLDLDQLFGTNRDNKGYFEWNRENISALYIDEKENAIDSLETALQFLDRNDNLKWKWVAFALHHSLYSFCISALEGGNYENVLVRGLENEWVVSYPNDNVIKKSIIVPFYIKGYKTSAFRIGWEKIDEFPKRKKKKTIHEKSKNNLIGFWTALARIQDQFFWMGRLVCTKAVTISDVELEKIVWLSEAVRNDLAHFIPQGYSIEIKSIIAAALTILDKIDYLVFHSYSIVFVDYGKTMERLRNVIPNLRVKLINELNEIENSKK